MIRDHTDVPISSLVSLSGRRAVVTGGARGIGASIVHRLAETGASVVVADLDEAGACRVASAAQERFGGEHVGLGMDLADTASIEAVAEHAARAGGLDIWVNNAGIFPTTGSALEVTDEFIDRMLTINVRGSFAAAREAAKRMEAGGVIVAVASTAAFGGSVGISAYSVSKHAVLGVVRNLALELAPRDIRVLGVAPTVIDTPGVQEQLAPLRAAGLDVSEHIGSTALGRGGVPDDVARVVLFCASDMAAFMTGSTLLVDAGALA